MKNLLMQNETKQKSIIIDGDLHNKLKVLCKGKCLKIGGVVEDLIYLYLNNPKDLQDKIDKVKDNYQHSIR
jgi:hypothetical protein